MCLERDVVMKFETYVKEIVPRTYNVKSFRFTKPETLSYKPGQFLLLTIKSAGKGIDKTLQHLKQSHRERAHRVYEETHGKRVLHSLKHA